MALEFFPALIILLVLVNPHPVALFASHLPVNSRFPIKVAPSNKVGNPLF